MKVGIVTFHRAHNYGAMLQCYSLANVLSRLGYKVEVIDYLPEKFEAEYSLWPCKQLSFKHNVGKILKMLPVFSTAIKRNKAFNNFLKKLPLSRYYSPRTHQIDGYDTIVFGSDQIWNPLLTNSEDIIYSGSFKKNNTRFISYAASSNPILYDGKYDAYFKSIVNNFDAISTREKTLCDYLNTIKSECATIVLDPVFLLDAKSWEKISIEPKENDYLLIYTVPQTPVIYKLAKKIAHDLNLKIVEIRPNTNKGGIRGAYRYATPEEFLGLFIKASFVLTTSFHGTSFSVIFRKPFFTVSIGKNVNDRSSSLLRSLGLEDRILENENISVNPFINYSDVDVKLQHLINKSNDFLKKSIK